MQAYHDIPVWNRKTTEFSWDCYLGGDSRGGEDVSAYTAPARAEDLSGLPPAFVSACQFDPFCDEDIAYVQRLALAGVPTEFVLYPGTVHATNFMQDTAVGKRINADVTAALRRSLAVSAPEHQSQERIPVFNAIQ